MSARGPKQASPVCRISDENLLSGTHAEATSFTEIVTQAQPFSYHPLNRHPERWLASPMHLKRLCSASYEQISEV